MAGLPRSGGTLISSILNQNPDIYVSPESVLSKILMYTYNEYQSAENLDCDQSDKIYECINNTLLNFYSNSKEKYIIDKSFYWLQRHQYLILENHLNNPIKIICPVRDIMHILASWNKLLSDDANNEFDKKIIEKDETDRRIEDKRADYIMQETDIYNFIEGMKRSTHPNFKNEIFFIDYNDLVENTEKTISSIYEFLNIEKYVHDFNFFSTPHNHTDHWGIKDHHKVKEKLIKDNYDIEKIFSKETIEKYSGMEFWKEKI